MNVNLIVLLMYFNLFCIDLYCVSVLIIQKSYLISDNESFLQISRNYYLILFFPDNQFTTVIYYEITKVLNPYFSLFVHNFFRSQDPQCIPSVVLRKILDFPIADANTSYSSHLKQEKDQEVIILYLDSLFDSLLRFKVRV